jgi:hypothetical protein
MFAKAFPHDSLVDSLPGRNKMISRITFSIGFALASLIWRGAAQAADAAGHQVVCAHCENIPEIALKPSVSAVQFTVSSDDWQRSSPKPSGSLRFTKPKIPASSPSTIQPTAIPLNASPLLQPDSIAGQSAQKTVTKRFDETRPAVLNDVCPQESLAEGDAAITIISDDVNDRERAYAAAAMLKALIEHPEAEAVTDFNEALPEAGVATNTRQEPPFEIQPSDQASYGVIRAAMERMRFIAQRITEEARPSLPPEERNWGRGPIGDGVTW